MNIDFSFLNWEIVRAYVASGFIFSIQLTLIAMVGGIALGTLLALARLSGRKAFEVPATMKPGMRTFFSMKANTRFTAKAEIA